MRFVKTVNNNFADNLPTFPITKSLWSYLKLLLICLLKLGFGFDQSLPRGKPVGKSPYYRSFDRSANWRVKDSMGRIWHFVESSTVCSTGVGYGKLGRLFQILVDAPKWITWPALDEQARILNEAKLETRVIAIGERLGGMWSVSRSILGHPARRDGARGSSRSPRTPSRATVPLLRYAPLTWQRYGGSGTGYRNWPRYGLRWSGLCCHSILATRVRCCATAAHAPSVFATDPGIKGLWDCAQ